MGQETGISWTDHTFNPWWGCTKVSPGCDGCYAEAFDKRTGGAHWGKGAPRRSFGDKHWAEPLKWNRLAEAAGTPAKVFVASMADVNDDEAPAGQRERLYRLIDNTQYLIWQMLTKRPQRYERYLPANGFRHNNVILMATAENQEFYMKRKQVLIDAAQSLQYRNAERMGVAEAPRVLTGVSYEPALGPLTLWNTGMKPDWLIFGGETGPKPRPMETAWAENIKRECEEFGVAFFMKQMSARTPAKASALIPAELLLRQFPSISGAAVEGEK